MIELEIMAIEDSSGYPTATPPIPGVDPITNLATPGFGQYQGQARLVSLTFSIKPKRWR